VTHSSGIMTLNSPGGSTVQCGRWLWDYMPLNSPKRPPYWNSTPDFDFDHITAVDMSFCNSFRHFIQIGPPSAEKNDVVSIFKMVDISHLGFYGSNNGSLKSPIQLTKLLSFPENRVFCILASTSKMAGLRHIGFYGSNNGFFEKSVYDFL